MKKSSKKQDIMKNPYFKEYAKKYTFKALDFLKAYYENDPLLKALKKEGK